ncbi:hypothetical protein MLD38_004521 [Melastoma candidum]|uniref:Uncharacterized protein n=1 Tax=Melastoma candidum TaxID=119954 RepID=A0ACB9S7H8_9MYRT|nr:hypothetical protein MLD38_004521 [Melastoma candidum]
MILAWNVRSLNDPLHLREVHNLIRKHKLSLVGLLETKARGIDTWTTSDDTLNEALMDSGLDGLRGIGPHYTWLNRREQLVLRKLDRAVVNIKWIEPFGHSEVEYLPPLTSDHSPCLVRLVEPSIRKTPFKFFDFWRMHPLYETTVKEGWSKEYGASPLFSLYRKIKDLKIALKGLNMLHIGDIPHKVAETKLILDEIKQEELAGCGSAGLKQAVTDFNLLARMEENMLWQKSQVRWLKLRDRNTRFFHILVTSRCSRNVVTKLLVMGIQLRRRNSSKPKQRTIFGRNTNLIRWLQFLLCSNIPCQAALFTLYRLLF